MKKRTKLWKRCMAATMSFIMLSAGSVAYAGGVEGDLEPKTTGQNNQDPCIIRKEAEPRKLKDGDTVKDLYEIIVKDNDKQRTFTVNGMTTDEADLMPFLLAVDGSHFYADALQVGGTLLSPERLEGTVDGSDTDVLFDYEILSGGGMGSGGNYLLSGNATYCDLYAKTKDGKPISGLSVEYAANQHGDIVGGVAVMNIYDENGKIIKKKKLDGWGKIHSSPGKNGYAQLTGWGHDTVNNFSESQ